MISLLPKNVVDKAKDEALESQGSRGQDKKKIFGPSVQLGLEEEGNCYSERPNTALLEGSHWE